MNVVVLLSKTDYFSERVSKQKLNGQRWLSQGLLFRSNLSDLAWKSAPAAFTTVLLKLFSYEIP